MAHYTTRQKTNYHIRITGRVQGVLFRVSAKQQAEALGITGTIRNNLDGSVTIEAEGILNSLQEFVEWCHHGPKRAKVERVDFEEAGRQYFDDFRVL